MLTSTRLLIIIPATLGCSLSTPGIPTDPGGPSGPYYSQGVVSGFVQNSSGRGVANAIVCATAVFQEGGILVVNALDTTRADGGYVVPINLTSKLDARGYVMVAASPPIGSGLAPAMASQDTFFMTTSLPPAETAHVNVVVPAGSPSGRLYCLNS